MALLSAGFAGWGAATLALAAFGAIAGLSGIVMGLLIGLMILPFWVGGLFVLGGPLWAVLHWKGRRDRRTAVIAGALCAAVVAPLMIWAMFTDLRFTLGLAGAGSLLLTAIPAGIGGGTAGLAAWHVGYAEGGF